MNTVRSKMKTELTKNLACILDTIMVLVAMSLCACNNGDVSSSSAFTPDTYGMPLHGDYRFDCGDGELSALVSPEGVEVVPPGAVLSVVRTGYCIGYYDRGAFFFRDGQRISLDKVFFAVQSNGELDFYEESKERSGFFGAKIAEPVQFERDNKGDRPGTDPIHALVFSGCQSSPSRASNDGLQPGETIWVCNAQHIVKTEDTEVRIQADGTATLPIIGAVRLAGLTISEAERTVQDAYRASGVYIHLQVRILRE